MKSSLLLFGCLLVVFGGHTALGQNYNPQHKGNDRPNQNSHSSSFSSSLSSSSSFSSSSSKRYPGMSANSQLDIARQKCSQKEGKAISDRPYGNANRINQSICVPNRPCFAHYYEQIIDQTGKVYGRYYGIDKKSGEIHCGKLTFF